jgi:hypothetical protein
VLATTEVNSKGQSKLLGSGPGLFKDIGARPGNGLLPPDPGGVDRRITHSVDKLQTLAVATTEVADKHKVDRAIFGGEPAWIDYYGPPGTIPAISRAGATPRGRRL